MDSLGLRMLPSSPMHPRDIGANFKHQSVWRHDHQSQCSHEIFFPSARPGREKGAEDNHIMIRGVYMAWNVFKWCKGLKALGSLMIVAVLAIIAITYYSVVIMIYGPQLLRGHALLAAIPILLVFHALLVMLLWCYAKVAFTDPGKVPENWRPIRDEEENEVHPDSLSAIPSLDGVNSSIADTTTENGSTRLPNVRYCRKCSQFKPPRSHHCSVCGRCVLKMDHHCVWVVNCVGAYNYKFFLLFLLYTFLETTLCTFVLLPHFIAFFRGIGNEQDPPAYVATIFLAFVLNVAFMLSLLGFLTLHASLVGSNTTTIEVHEKKSSPRWRYDLGARENFEQVFGKTKLCWLIPVYSERDKQTMHVLQGLEYPERPDNEEQYFN